MIDAKLGAKKQYTFYFVTNKLDKNLSSVEEVELNRLKIFKKICVPAKILTLMPDLHFDERQKQYHVEQDSISLFDWLLLKDQIDTRPIVNYLDIFNNLGAKGHDHVRYYDNGLKAAEAFFTDGNNISYINVYNGYGRILKQILFSRSHIAGYRFFDDRNHLVLTEYYDGNNQITLRYYYSYQNKQAVISRIEYKDQSFNNKDEFLLFALKFFKKEHHGPYLIDRTNVLEKSLWLDQDKIFAHDWIVSHEGPNWINNGQVVNSNFFNNLSKLHNQHMIQGVICETKRACRDLATSHGFDPADLVAASPMFCQKYVANTDDISRNKYKLLMVARVDPIKRIDDAIQAVIDLHDNKDYGNLPVSLDVYGGISFHQEKDKLLKLIHDNHAEDYIHLCNFTTDQDKIYQNHIFNLCTSVSEGFNLGLFQASGRGLINISYDIKYGPRENILNDKTGSLLPLDSHNDRNSRSKLLADCLRSWLEKSDEEIAESMRLAQKLTYEKYNFAQVCQDWHDIAKIIENHT